jgi:hypothetical protein
MTSRARIFDLYARREAALVAGLGRAVSRAAGEVAMAEAAGARLRQIAQDVQLAPGPTLAANLRACGMLATGLSEEAARQHDKAALAAAEVARLRQKMTFHDRRCQFGETAATNARLADAEAAEARAEAARPVPRRG